jgi:hypothetical protein
MISLDNVISHPFYNLVHVCFHFTYIHILVLYLVSHKIDRHPSHVYLSHVLFLKDRLKNFDKYYMLAGAIKHMHIYPSHVCCLIIYSIFFLITNRLL